MSAYAVNWKTEGGSALAAAGELEPLLNDLATQTTNFSSKRKGVLAEDVPERERVEVNRSTSRWGAVKTWEVMHEFELEGLAPEVFPDGEVPAAGSARGATSSRSRRTARRATRTTSLTSRRWWASTNLPPGISFNSP